MKKETVQIVMISDPGYLIPTIVAITSMKVHAAGSRDYRITVLASGFDEAAKKRFLELESENFKVQILECNPDDYCEVDTKKVSATKAAILKFFIPEILNDTEKVIYIDGDTIVIQDIATIYDENIENYYAGVVRDVKTLSKGIWDGEGNLYSCDEYFNSGMMLLNTKKLREERMSEKLVDYRVNHKNFFMDQDAFNATFGWKRVKFFSPLYNVLLHSFTSELAFSSWKEYQRYYGLSEYKNFDSFMNDAVMLHFAGPKPWKFYDTMYSNTWYSYYKKSPLNSVSLERNAYYWDSIYRFQSYKIMKKARAFCAMILRRIKK